ncbi:holin [Pseudonocardia sp. C8]
MFWKDAAERALKTAAQALLSIWLVGDVAFDLLSVDWGSRSGSPPAPP